MQSILRSQLKPPEAKSWEEQWEKVLPKPKNKAMGGNLKWLNKKQSS